MVCALNNIALGEIGWFVVECSFSALLICIGASFLRGKDNDGG